MITKRPATAVNLCFALCIAIGAIALLGHYTITNASNLQSYCERQYNASFFKEISPMAKKRCKLIFEKITYEWTTGLYNQSK